MPRPKDPKKECRTFWGSHGCMKRIDHDGAFHQCNCNQWILELKNWPDRVHAPDQRFGIDKQGYVWCIYV